MAQALQPSFTAGEISPDLHARVDLDRYAVALRRCINFIVRASGGIINRPGTQFIYKASLPDREALLLPFTYSTEQAYMLEFGHQYIRVFANGALIQGSDSLTVTNVTWAPSSGKPGGGWYTVTTSAPHGLAAGQPTTISGVVATGWIASVNDDWSVADAPSATTFTLWAPNFSAIGAYTSGGTVGAPGELATPYDDDQLDDVTFTQSADVLTLAHPDHPLYELRRTAVDTFEFAVMTLDSGPFRDLNVDEGITVYASAVSGSVTLTASASIFLSDHIGSLFYLEERNLRGVAPWEPDKEIAAIGANPLGQMRRSDGKVYQCATSEVAAGFPIHTGTVRPVHLKGIQQDGDGSPIANAASRAGVEWEFLHAGYGIVRIAAVGSGTSATATVLTQLPPSVVGGAANLTDAWAFGAWSRAYGYPGEVEYYGDRLIGASTVTQPQTVWTSRTGVYNDFLRPLIGADDDPIVSTLNARQVNAILDLIPLDSLIVSTASGEWRLKTGQDDVITPASTGYKPQSAKGSNGLPALLVNDSALFVQDKTAHVHDIFVNELGNYTGQDLSIAANHLVDRYGIVGWAYQKTPFSVIWLARNDGTLLSLTYLREQQVVGWAQHDIGGKVERLCCIPEGDEDALYMVVLREIDGEDVRYVERLSNRFYDDVRDAIFMDCAITYDGRHSGATTMTLTGSGWTNDDQLTLTASAATFAAGDIDDQIVLRYAVDVDPDTDLGELRLTIEAYTSPTVVTARPNRNVPVAMRGAETGWGFGRNVMTQAEHLEGESVAILADGEVMAAREVVGGEIELDAPSVVVHIGIFTRALAETLDITVLGQNSVRMKNKLIPRVGLLVSESRNIKAGMSESMLGEYPARDVSDAYNLPAAISDLAEVQISATWEDKGRFVVVQDQPLPLTLLGVIPDISVGS